VGRANQEALQQPGKMPIGGMAGWLMAKLHRAGRGRSRLLLVERITLAPRQSLALVEAEGRRLLVATSADGASAFYPLDERPRASQPCAGDSLTKPRRRTKISPRVSW
jgi:flagellar biogenesis protein FliO